ncbi:MAG: lipocalin-like domain-containing protein [Sphingomonas sp.]|nr:MAG: lipocalin-like domain-containing protein [Sphingomonas sp.]
MTLAANGFGMGGRHVGRRAYLRSAGPLGEGAVQRSWTGMEEGGNRMIAKTMQDRLVGSWTLLSYVQSFDDGRPDLLPMGSDPSGLIVYTHDGYMSAQLCPADRPAFASDVVTDGEEDEYARAARTYIAYAGPYTCDHDSGTVSHHVRVSVFPNWVGGDQVRQVVFSGATLRLSSIRGAPGSRPGAVQTLTWRRAT